MEDLVPKEFHEFILMVFSERLIGKLPTSKKYDLTSQNTSMGLDHDSSCSFRNHESCLHLSTSSLNAQLLQTFWNWIWCFALCYRSCSSPTRCFYKRLNCWSPKLEAVIYKGTVLLTWSLKLEAKDFRWEKPRYIYTVTCDHHIFNWAPDQ